MASGHGRDSSRTAPTRLIHRRASGTQKEHCRAYIDCVLDLTQPKVSHLDSEIFVHQYVMGFEVAVDDLLLKTATDQLCSEGRKHLTCVGSSCLEQYRQQGQ